MKGFEVKLLVELIERELYSSTQLRKSHIIEVKISPFTSNLADNLAILKELCYFTAELICVHCRKNRNLGRGPFVNGSWSLFGTLHKTDRIVSVLIFLYR